jgi:tol-pal system protein YbgF
MKRALFFGILGLILAGASPAKAGTQEELVRLQTDVLALQNQMRVLEKTVTDQTDGLRSLVVQLSDQVGKSNLFLERISTTLENQAAGSRNTDQSLAQDLRSLSNKLDDTVTRISALAQQIAELKIQPKPMSSAPGGDGDVSADSVFNQAFNDLVQGNFDLAVQGFSTFLRSYPGNAKANAAQYGIGEAYYNQNKLPQAIAAFTRTITEYPEGDKVASAYFKRGKAELGMKETENAIADFRTVLDKYPDAPEAGLAKSELERLGVSLRPAKAPVRRKP